MFILTLFGYLLIFVFAGSMGSFYKLRFLNPDLYFYQILAMNEFLAKDKYYFLFGISAVLIIACLQFVLYLCKLKIEKDFKSARQNVMILKEKDFKASIQ